jgi:long-chain acyl-CoA synthetase
MAHGVKLHAANWIKINDSESRLVFVGSQDQYDKVCSFIDDTPTLRKVIALNPDVDLKAYPESMYFEDFLCKGREERTEHEIDARLSLCFSPLSHIFERAWTYYVLYKGMANNYLEDPKQIIEFIKEVKPTIMYSVPRFYEKIYAMALHRLESASTAKRRLFHWAIRTGASYHNPRKEQLPIPPMISWKYRLADKLVLQKIRAIVGGRIKFFPCAGAPLAREIEEFFYATGIFICYGYSLSETTATVTCHELYHFKFGLVGKPMPGVQVKIGPMNEILVKERSIK